MRVGTLQVVLYTLVAVTVVLTIAAAVQHSIMMRRMVGMRGFQPVWWIGPGVMFSLTLTIVVAVLYLLVYRGGSGREAYSMVIKGLTEEERKVVEYIAENGGEVLQKDIARDLGLSRLKTHRLVSSLRKRGVVEVEQWGNTNKVRLRREVK